MKKDLDVVIQLQLKDHLLELTRTEAYELNRALSTALWTEDQNYCSRNTFVPTRISYKDIYA